VWKERLMSELPTWAAGWDGETETLATHIEELNDRDACEVFESKFEAFWQGYAVGRLAEKKAEAAIDRATRG
jgi:hypothetical protein